MSRDINVIVLFQGGLGESLAKSVCDGLRKANHPYSTYNINPFRLSDGENSADIVHEKLIKTIKIYDNAIAIISFDPRPASSAGNIWMEIGLWCGVKSRSNLLICMQEHTDVKMISNMEGIVQNSFKYDPNETTNLSNASDTIIKKFYQFIQNQKETKSKNFLKEEAKKLAKIKNTILDGADHIQDVSQLFICNKTGEPINCDKKSVLFQFSSELMRMGKSSWEHNYIQFSLSEIGSILNLIVKTYQRELKDEKDKLYAYENRMELLRELRETVSKLLVFFKDTVQRDGYKEKLKPVEKLKKYINYRIDIAEIYFQTKKHAKFPRGSCENCQQLKERVESFFVKWLDKFPKIITQYENFDFNPKGKDEVGWSDLYHYKDVALQLSKLFEILGDNFFDETRKVFKEERGKILNSGEVTKIIADIPEKLPHNFSQTVPAIWPNE